jgi:hypothetical protein
MRFIPYIQRVKEDKHPKIIKWRNRQTTFLNVIENPSKFMAATSWEILQQDKNIQDFETIQKRIMGINSKQRPAEPLFLSVDTSFFRSNEVIISFLPRHEAEARMFVINVVPYFKHMVDDEILRYAFQQETLDRSSQSIWNADLKEVISPSDLYLEQSGEIEDDFDLLQVMGIETVQQHHQQNHSSGEGERIERLFTGEDVTSAGTLFTNDLQRNETMTKTNTVANSTQSTYNRSMGTSLTTEEVEKNLLIFPTNSTK